MTRFLVTLDRSHFWPELAMFRSFGPNCWWRLSSRSTATSGTLIVPSTRKRLEMVQSFTHWRVWSPNTSTWRTLIRMVSTTLDHCCLMMLSLDIKLTSQSTVAKNSDLNCLLKSQLWRRWRSKNLSRSTSTSIQSTLCPLVTTRPKRCSTNSRSPPLWQSQSQQAANSKLTRILMPLMLFLVSDMLWWISLKTNLWIWTLSLRSRTKLKRLKVLSSLLLSVMALHLAQEIVQSQRKSTVVSARRNVLVSLKILSAASVSPQNSSVWLMWRLLWHATPQSTTFHLSATMKFMRANVASWIIGDATSKLSSTVNKWSRGLPRLKRDRIKLKALNLDSVSTKPKKLKILNRIFQTQSLRCLKRRSSSPDSEQWAVSGLAQVISLMPFST